MPVPAILLFACHGTPGAVRAAELAFNIAVAGTSSLVHALMVAEFRGGMQGDDRLKNTSTRDTFAGQGEGQLAAESAALVEALRRQSERHGLACHSLRAFGGRALRRLPLPV